MNGIIAFSVILWVFIDRAKKLWANLSWGGYLTSAIALVAGMVIAFVYGLDLLTAIGLTETASVGGSIFAGFALAGGSSCIHELITKVQGEKTE